MSEDNQSQSQSESEQRKSIVAVSDPSDATSGGGSMNTGDVVVLTMATSGAPNSDGAESLGAAATIKVTQVSVGHAPISLEEARDIDGVQLIRHHKPHTLMVSQAILSPANSDLDSAPRTHEFSHVGSNRPPPIHQLNPDRYRQLAKGLVQLKSNLIQSGKSSTDMPSVAEKKKVRFSDQSGYDLYVLRSYTDQEMAPTVPLYATAYLKLDDEIADVVDDSAAAAGSQPCKFVRTCFTQPGALPDFLTRIRQQKVALEFCMVNEKDFTLTGTIRVMNLHFHKKVIIVFTNDHWKTKAEAETHYVHYSNDGETDLFTFRLLLPEKTLSSGEPFEFIARYEVGGAIHWDNNFGKNYSVMCVSSLTTPMEQYQTKAK